MSFLHLKSVKNLQNLARQSVDLTQDGVFNGERIETMRQSAIGFDLLYAAERVTPAVIEALFELSDEAMAMQKMADMQAGVEMNRIEGFDSEQRAVLHTAMRDQFTHRQKAKNAMAASDMAQAELQKLERFLEVLDRENRFTDLIQIGIGGSDLGPRALYLALLPFARPHHRVHFISNVDPDDANNVLNRVDLKKTLVVVVSKSGTTLETLTNEEFVRARLQKLGLDPKEHFIAVTGEKSPMDNPAKYKASFYIWDFVGGRYSSTSMAGAVAIGFAYGFSALMEILRGAHAMDAHAMTKRNLPLLSALLGIWNRNFLQLPTAAVVPYSQALIRFPAHLQQLDMESNGKSVDITGHFVDFSTGPVVWGEIGTNAQHSFYQLIHQGTQAIPVEFIGFRKSQHPFDLDVKGSSSQEKLLANLFAQSIALAKGQKSANPNRFFPGNRPNRILLADRLDPYTLGALLAFYEHKVALQGFIWNINSFDQEGVQLGKVLASQILDLFAAQRSSKSGPSFEVGEAYLRILNAKK
ncbi:MAG: pgi [Parachlamydiales bacterium]|nr:pgi [Parachlamydiales bacterium]